MNEFTIREEIIPALKDSRLWIIFNTRQKIETMKYAIRSLMITAGIYVEGDK